MNALLSLCKRRGFIYPGSEIYGGFANSWDYGPYGAELKKRIKDAWWDRFVRFRPDVMGIETPVIMNPKVWEASGHVGGFTDPLVDCKKCKHRFRADHLLEAQPPEPGSARKDPLDMTGVRCPNCGGELTEVRQFNMMFKTQVGVTDESSADAYLRPETAGGMFVAWKNVRDSMRTKLPMGVAQIGKAFRNEITPGNFIFRTREFEQMEIEYFCLPDDAPRAFELWLDEMKKWMTDVLKVDPAHVNYHEIPDGERAHYSARTVDVEYQYPFGMKELYGLANRTDYDLKRHQEASQQDLRWLNPETNEKVLPYVVEPTWGLDRTVLVVLLEHLDVDEAPAAGDGEDKEPRMVLRLPPRLAPVTVAVLPLQKKEGMPEKAQEVIAALNARGIATEYDASASIGKRYRRQDEIGTPWCVTVDGETLRAGTVTVRDRDTMEQEKVPVADLAGWIAAKL